MAKVKESLHVEHGTLSRGQTESGNTGRCGV